MILSFETGSELVRSETVVLIHLPEQKALARDLSA